MHDSRADHWPGFECTPLHFCCLEKETFRFLVHSSYSEQHQQIASTHVDILSASSVDRQYDFVGLDATRCHINQTLSRHPLNSSIIKCAWNFPSVDQNDSDTSNDSLLRGFFMSVAAYFENKYTDHNALREFEVGLALQGNEFSRWNILNSAQNAGFVLEWWDDFKPSSFPNYKPRQSKNDPVRAVRHARFYVFRLKRRQYSE